MANHSIEASIDLQDFTGDNLIAAPADASDGAGEINLGAFRGLAFALIFETVLVALGGVVWQLLRFIHW
jgi:hypothetical protein